MTNLNLWPIGNCQVSALVDARAGMVWACQPRIDGDRVFSSLLSPVREDPPPMPAGEWRIELEGQISAERAQRVKARLVLEGANGPTVPTADDILAERGVLVVPDVICNAGGVTVSYFEWVQDFSSFFWSEDEINLRLDKIMVDALKKIWDTADKHRITLRTATFAVACERILIAREERGLYP